MQSAQVRQRMRGVRGTHVGACPEHVTSEQSFRTRADVIVALLATRKCGLLLRVTRQCRRCISICSTARAANLHAAPRSEYFLEQRYQSCNQQCPVHQPVVVLDGLAVAALARCEIALTQADVHSLSNLKVDASCTTLLNITVALSAGAAQYEARVCTIT